MSLNETLSESKKTDCIVSSLTLFTLKSDKCGRRQVSELAQPPPPSAIRPGQTLVTGCPAPRKEKREKRASQLPISHASVRSHFLFVSLMRLILSPFPILSLFFLFISHSSLSLSLTGDALEVVKNRRFQKEEGSGWTRAIADGFASSQDLRRDNGGQMMEARLSDEGHTRGTAAAAAAPRLSVRLSVRRPLVEGPPRPPRKPRTDGRRRRRGFRRRRRHRLRAPAATVKAKGCPRTQLP
jgi:hypothetical protein